MNCLTNIVGITRTPCECLEPDLPEGYTESTSGLYMDELAESPFQLMAIKSLNDCGKDTAFLLTNAREQAINQFRTDLFMHLQQRFKTRTPPYTGLIGKDGSGYPSLAVYGSVAGVKLDTRYNRGSSITVKNIKVASTTVGTFELTIYKKQGSKNFTPLHTILLEADGGVKDNELPEPIVLDLADQSEEMLSYYFMYSLADMTPRSNPVTCGCGSENDLHRWLTASGVNGNIVDAKLSSSQYANGIILGVDIRCGNDDIICKAFLENEFIRVGMADAIQRKSVANLIDQVLHSEQINRYTQAKREQMYYDKGTLNKQYKNAVQWVSENMSMSLNDCYVCQTIDSQVSLSGILL